MRRALAAIVLLLGVTAPRIALACASCLSTAYGDRTYNIAYLGLILTPFAIVLAIGIVITRSWRAGSRPGDEQTTDPSGSEETT